MQQRRLAWLEGLIKTRQTTLGSLQQSMRGIAGQIDQTQSQYESVQALLNASQRDYGLTNDYYRSLRRQVRAIATNAYIAGPAAVANMILDATSVSGVEDVLQFSGVLLQRDVNLAHKARVVAASLKSKAQQEQSLLDERAALLARLHSQQDALTASFTQTQQQLSGIARVQGQVVSLLSGLRKKLQAEQLAAAEASLGGTPLAFGRWAQAFLTFITAPVARNNLISLVAWQTAEYTNARWNPLATTYPMPGDSTFNGASVRNYVSLAQGLQATLKTLQAPGHSYEAILRSLASNADPMTTARAINASDWCHGCSNGQYVIDLIPTVTQYFDHYAQGHAA
ncbi:MAG: hypothetical protein ACYDCC_01455 [Actinomycetota bacterium]